MTENRLDISMTIHFTVPDGMSREEAHHIMLSRMRGWLDDPDNEVRSSWGLFSRNSEPEEEPCLAVWSSTVSSNLLDGVHEGVGTADARTGITPTEHEVWGALSTTGSRPALDVADALGLSAHEAQGLLRRLEARGLAQRDAEGTWWRRYF